ncbi:MAG: hypothetical protein JW810_08730 [Sedimentisphaerales bacterium]|nr:hypothetical protein [Sedimentisphaerales bacterium]
MEQSPLHRQQSLPRQTPPPTTATKDHTGGPPWRAGPAAGGFTLVELLLATVIGALVIVIALGSLRQVAQGRAKALYISEITAHGRYALDCIRNDLANFYRGSQSDQMRLIGIPGGTEDLPADRLLARITGQPERTNGSTDPAGDIFEIEYGLFKSQNDCPEGLGRRCAAVFDVSQDNEQGRITHTASFVTSLKCEFYNGKSWQRNWSAEQGVCPLVRVSLQLRDRARPQYGSVSVSQTISLEPLPEHDIAYEQAVSTTSAYPPSATE